MQELSRLQDRDWKQLDVELSLRLGGPHTGRKNTPCAPNFTKFFVLTVHVRGKLRFGASLDRHMTCVKYSIESVYVLVKSLKFIVEFIKTFCNYIILYYVHISTLQAHDI